MKLISIKDLKQPRDLKRRLLEEKQLLLTSDGTPVAVLLSVDPTEDPEEIMRAIKSARSREALQRIREAARRNGTDKMTPAEIQKEIAASRKNRKVR